MDNFGFVVPVFCVKEEYLRKCVDSIRAQSYQGIQIVLVDDCSIDNCGSICDQLASIDSRIIVKHHSENRGLSSTRNTGIDALSTDWVCFVDADDWVEPNMCSMLLEEVRSVKADVYIYSGFRDFRDRTEECAYQYPTKRIFTDSNDKDELERRFLIDQTNIHVDGSFPIQSACIRMVSMDFLRKTHLRFANVKFAEDALFHMYSTELAPTVVYLPLNLYHYRNTSNSMVNSYRKNADSEQLEFLAKLWEFAMTFNKSNSFINDLFYISFISMQMCVWQKFFNPENREKYLVKRKSCGECFKQFPYCSTLSSINYHALRRNQKIKYVLMRLGLYRLIVLMRDVYLRLSGATMQ